MTFVFLKDKHNEWWKWNKDHMTLVNFKGGHFEIDENADYWLSAKVFEFDNWHELYLATKFNPLEEDEYAHSAWLSPEGEFFIGTAHAVDAEDIASLVYGLEFDILDYSDAEEYLINEGWKKVTASAMWRYYCEDSTWDCTPKQYGALKIYCDVHKIKFPTSAYIKRRN